MNSFTYFSLVTYLTLVLGGVHTNLEASELPFKFGNYQTVDKQQDAICPQGQLQLVGSAEDTVLVFGPNIFFPNPHGGQEKERPEANGCEYSIVTVLKDSTLTKTTTIKLCPEKQFNNVIVESLTQISNDQLQYQLKSKDENGAVDVKCLSKKIKE